MWGANIDGTAKYKLIYNIWQQSMAMYNHFKDETPTE